MKLHSSYGTVPYSTTTVIVRYFRTRLQHNHGQATKTEANNNSNNNNNQTKQNKEAESNNNGGRLILHEE